MKHLFLILIAIVLKAHFSWAAYGIPIPKILTYKPKGIRVSIPDVPNIVAFAFHAKVNRPFKGNEVGDFNGRITASFEKEWVFIDEEQEFDVGDIIYYWIFVQNGQLAYMLENKMHTVTELRDIPQWGIIHPQAAADPTTVAVPDVTVRPLIAPVSVTASTPVGTTPKAAACTPTVTKVNRQSVCAGALIFEENFNGRTINKTVWKQEVRMPLDKEDAEFVAYQKQNSYIEDGNLVIAPNILSRQNNLLDDDMWTGSLDITDGCTPEQDYERECKRTAGAHKVLPPVVTSKMNTKNYFSFLYGKIEIRAKFPEGDWLFPQLYLEPASPTYGVSEFASGLLRVAFARGNPVLLDKDSNNIGATLLCGGAILSRSSKLRQNWMLCHDTDTLWTDDYHVYTMKWTEGGIAFEVDGVKYGSIKNNLKSAALVQNIKHAALWDGNSFTSPFDKEFYISLGVGAGGIGDFPDQSKSGIDPYNKPWGNSDPKAELNFYNATNKWHTSWTAQKSRLLVDYVKVWAL